MHLTSELIKVIEAVFYSVQYQMGAEITYFIASVLVFTALFLLQKKSKRFSETLKEKYGKHISALIDIAFPSIFYAWTKLFALFVDAPFAEVLFELISYLYLGLNVIKILFAALDDKGRFRLALSWILLIISAFSLLVSNLLIEFVPQTDSEQLYTLIFKISTILLFYIFVLSAIRYTANLIPLRFNALRKIYPKLNIVLPLVVVLIAAFWIREGALISSLTILGLAVTISLSVVYSIVRALLGSFIYPITDKQENMYPGLSEDIRHVIFFGFVLTFYEVFKIFFSLGRVIAEMQTLFIIDTDIIHISLFTSISAVFTFFVIFSIINLIKHFAYYISMKHNREADAESFRALVMNLGMVVSILIAVSVLGLTWKALIPIAGALGIGIGFGLQSIMNNYISGFILLFNKKIKVGDIIEIDGNAGRAILNNMETIYGRISKIDSMNTTLTTTDGIEIVIPNSNFISEKIVNYSLTDDYIRVRIPFGVSYGSDPNAVKQILLQVASEHSQILDNPPPNVWFSEMGDNAIVFYLLVWVDIRLLWRINPFISDIYFNGWYALKRSDVVIPFPQRDVWFKNELRVELKRDNKKHNEGTQTNDTKASAPIVSDEDN